jgi:hypothetical protein
MIDQLKRDEGVSGDQPADANPTQATGHADTQRKRKKLIVI